MVALIENLMIFVIGLAWAVHRRERAWGDISLALFALAVAAALESITGFVQLKLPDNHMVSAAHRWLAHGLVIVAWCAMIASIGATIASIRRRPTVALGAGIVVILTMLLVILESFTGYLGEGIRAGHPIANETLNRFYAIHCVSLPALILAATVGGALMLRRMGGALSLSNTSKSIALPPTSDNPYASPSE
jgi:quinol-cytochrome oxidoreductase complex cytochrome b subunit